MTGVKRSMMAAAGSAGGEGEYVEDVFSTYVYTGTGSALSINNGIDLDGEGGLVWMKNRVTAGRSHALYDTERGVEEELSTDTNTAEATENQGLTAFNANGFSVGNRSFVNTDDDSYASWTFRKAPGFFDVVAYTGDGTSDRELSHDLGSTPGFILIKSLEQDGVSWAVYHTSLGVGKELILNNNSAATSYADLWVSVSATTFNVQSNSKVNTDTEPYIAYLFANDAQIFGADGDESIIKCGSYTGNNSADGPTITLGWEPQWLLLKSSGSDGWQIVDVTRGWTSQGGGASSAQNPLTPHSNAAENSISGTYQPTSTGFKITAVGGLHNDNNVEYIYMAIRRPMKVPEAATEVFAIDTEGNAGSLPGYRSGFPVDMALRPETGGGSFVAAARLMQGKQLYTNGDSGQASGTSLCSFDYMNGYSDVTGVASGRISYMFKRAPEFMDVVAYAGFASPNPKALSHNLTVTPEMIIIKRRNGAQDWYVWSEALGVPDTPAGYMQLNTDVASSTGEDQIKAVAATTFSLKANENRTSAAGNTYIAYLFATLDGISKVGSYTADASLTTIDCGFAAGARFVLIKRTDATGDWYLYDSVIQGLVAGNDPYIVLNETDSQVTGTDYIDPDNSGFQITAAGSSTINVDTGEYIFLAIA